MAPMNNRLLRPRASGGFDPRSIAALAAWYDASDSSTITAVSGGVSVWLDKSGNSRTLYQGTANNRPITGTRTIGGLNGLDFDGTNDSLLSGDPALVPANGVNRTVDLQTPRAVTMFGVLFSDAPNSIRRWLSLQRNRSGEPFGNPNDTGAYMGRHSTGTATLEVAASAGDATSNDQLAKNFIRRTNTSFNSSDAEIVCGTISAANDTLTIRRNGVDQALTTRLGTGSAANFMSEGSGNHSLDVGAIRTADGSISSYWDGVIGEVLVYLSALTVTQAQAVERYLSRKWGVTL